MATLFKADKDVCAIVNSVRGEFHPHHVLNKVEATVVFAVGKIDEETGEPVGPAIVKFGFPQRATIQSSTPKMKAVGCESVLITLDSSWWSDATPEQRIAEIDRLWQSVEVIRDKDGEVKKTDCGKPKVKILPPDFVVTGYNAVIERHGLDSGDFEEVVTLLTGATPVADKGRQLELW